MKWNGITDVGRKRLVNQDSYALIRMKCGCSVAIVCDGMGGAAGGGIASSIAKDVFLAEIEKLSEEYIASGFEAGAPGVIFPRLLGEAVQAANRFTYDLSVGDPGLKGMGTTLVCALIYKDRIYVCNVGDSRLYAFSKGKAKQITKDHSYVQELLDSGMINQRQAKESYRKNIITRAVGVSEKILADTFVLNTEDWDYILLCTDGLSNLVSATELQTILYQPEDSMSFERKNRCMVDLANDLGGDDNITSCLIDLVSSGE